MHNIECIKLENTKLQMSKKYLHNLELFYFRIIAKMLKLMKKVITLMLL